MKNEPLILQELSVKKMPGLPHGLEKYTGFKPNLNIVAGPNASGKSSTAVLIQKMIWQRETDGISAFGRFLLGKDNWTIRVDGTSVRSERNGVPAALPDLPPPESYHRYIFALHQLVMADEQDAAKHIARLTVGGYDLESACQQLEYKDEIKRKTSAEFKAFRETREKVRRVSQQQLSLKKEEEKLTGLQQQLEQSKKADKLRTLFEKLIDFLHADYAYASSKRVFETYPAVLEKFTGEETERISGLDKEIAEAESKILDAKRVKETSQRILDDLTIPASGIDQAMLDTLANHVGKGEDLEREIRNNRRLQEEAEARMMRALADVDPDMDTGAWKGLQLQHIQQLDRFLRDAHAVYSQKQFLETEIRLLEQDLETDLFPEKVKLQDAIKILSSWLEENQSRKPVPIAWLIAAGILAFLNIPLTVYAGWWGLAGIAVIASMLAYALLIHKRQHTGLREKDYEKTGVDLPEAWTVDKVAEHFNRLTDSLQQVAWHEKLHQQISLRSTELESLTPRLEKLEQQRRLLADVIGTVPGLALENLKNETSLAYFVEKVKLWQEAHTAFHILKTQGEGMQQDLENILQVIHQTCEPYHNNRVDSVSGAKALVRNLEEQEQKRKNAVQELSRQQGRMDEYARLIEIKSRQRWDVYQKLDIAVDDRDTLNQLSGNLDAYRKARKDFREKELLMVEKRESVKRHALFGEYGEAIFDLDMDEANEKLSDYAHEAGMVESLHQEISGIETRIGHTMQGEELESSLSEEERALDGLQGLYEKNLSSVTGSIVAKFIRKETEEMNRPEVFHRANRLFGKVTHGRYSLRMHDRDNVAFFAYDHAMDSSLMLNELSTGTRIQLLLAVRLAFIESMEQGVSLPLLVDELLANSDDVRAEAIMDALTGISREGRQVFYFTAQADEVHKWTSFLEDQSNVSHKVFYLRGQANEETIESRSAPDLSALRMELLQVPDPAQMTHGEYGRRLVVTPFRLLTDTAEQLHLWYLVEDTGLLYHCLQRNITRWGQLAQFMKGGGIIAGMDAERQNFFEHQVDILNYFLELYRIGRARPIDRDVLEQSDAVSETFIDTVTDKLYEHGRDPAKLIDSLRSGEIARFRQHTTDALEAYLTEEGYLDDREPLVLEEIRIRLQAYVSGKKPDEAEAWAFLERTLGGDVS
ncbi:MAG: hypothetical protein EA394_09405 [Bacteroidia bacterium]|nr:MAG: hypothetical protein EA394_09405 [Bacteroidia bacterium]